MKYRATRSLQMSNKAVGVAGAPDLLKAGAELELDETTFKRLEQLYGEGALVPAKSPDKAAHKGPRETPAKDKPGKG